MAQMQPSGKVEAMSDLLYDVVTVLAKCGKAVDALDTYIDDAKRDNDQNVLKLFEGIREDEIRHCDMAKDVISNLVKQGKF